jgi:hypothetical protein
VAAGILGDQFAAGFTKPQRIAAANGSVVVGDLKQSSCPAAEARRSDDWA